MAYPTDSAALALSEIDSTLTSIRSRANSANAKLAAGNMSSEYVLNIHTDLQRTWQRLETLKSTPGIVAYAKDVKGNDTLDVVAEFSAVQAALVDARDWIETNWPKSDGWLQHVQFVSNEISNQTFSPAATEGLRAKLTALIATIAE